MWGPYYNYPLKFFNLCAKWVNECMQNTKNLILMNYKILKKTNHIYSIKITTEQRSPHVLFYYKLEKKWL